MNECRSQESGVRSQEPECREAYGSRLRAQGKDLVFYCLEPYALCRAPFFSSFDALECIECFSSQLVGFDVVEVCPPYDKGQTALLTARLVRYVIENVFYNNKG